MAPTFQFQKNLQRALQVFESMQEMAQSTWNHCPDQKGIKTWPLHQPYSLLWPGITALIKKGLRHDIASLHDTCDSLESLP